MGKIICTVFILLNVLPAAAQQNASVSFEKWISLKTVGGVVLSPDGKSAVYTVTSADWLNNSFDTEIWLCREGEPAFQLTRTFKGSSTSPQFTPDSKWVSFLADRGDKTQLYLIAVAGGEAFAVSKEEDGIGSYEWSPDGNYIAFTRAEPDTKKEKTSKERYGGFAVEGEEYKLNHLWLLRFNYDSVMAAGQLPCYTSKADSAGKTGAPTCYTLPKARRLTEGDFSVAGFNWSPDGKFIAFTRQPNPIITSSAYADIAVLDLAAKTTVVLVNNPGGDFFIDWSPDGKQFVYSSSLADTVSNYYRNNHLLIYDIASKKSREVAGDFDENKNVAEWNSRGIFFSAAQKTKAGIFEIDPASGKVNAVNTGIDIAGSPSFSKDAGKMAFSGRQFSSLQEVYLLTGGSAPKNISGSSAQLAGWNTPLNEVVQWKSKDGAVIEGVLLKPRNFDAARKYPLLVVVHGGPTGVDRPEPVPTYVYPIVQWCEKGALVLRVNYRGSAGYGEKFRSLNVGNLGVGDMWDVVSGVEYLNSRGMIDTAKMGCMGWSQGGYISAFLTTNTHMFKAISVGAGISNWVTYYVSTDITPFTRQYLKATPWSDAAVYSKTSPMTNINKANTPTLIQHGELDKRVPIPNAYELYRGLQDRNIPSKLVVYKGFGHGITKPKERLAAVWHNWQWFNHYVFGEAMEPMPAE